MKKSIVILSTLFFLSGAAATIVSCGQKSEQTEGHDHHAADTATQKDAAADTTQTAYACPMHPEVTGNEGDLCSKCNMKLEEVKEEAHQH